MISIVKVDPFVVLHCTKVWLGLAQCILPVSSTKWKVLILRIFFYCCFFLVSTDKAWWQVCTLVLFIISQMKLTLAPCFQAFITLDCRKLVQILSIISLQRRNGSFYHPNEISTKLAIFLWPWRVYSKQHGASSAAQKFRTWGHMIHIAHFAVLLEHIPLHRNDQQGICALLVAWQGECSSVGWIRKRVSIRSVLVIPSPHNLKVWMKKHGWSKRTSTMRTVGGKAWVGFTPSASLELHSTLAEYNIGRIIWSWILFGLRTQSDLICVSTH